MRSFSRIWPILQGTYYLLSGAWPLMHMRNFVAVTGPKTDQWLVRSFGALLIPVGASLMAAGLRSEQKATAVTTVGIGVPIAVGLAEATYATRGRIARVYLADAVAESILLVGWLRIAAENRTSNA